MTTRRSPHSRRVGCLLAAAMAGFGLVPSAGLGAELGRPDAAARTVVAEQYLRRPLTFEANKGQVDPRVKFVCRGTGSTLYLTPEEVVLRLSNRAPSEAMPKTFASASTPATGGPDAFTDTSIRMRLVGARPDPQVAGVDELPAKTNYYLGRDPSRWITNVSSYAKVRYEAVYPGVDLTCYGHERKLEYDFVVAPGADTSAVRIAFAGVDSLAIDGQGDLILHTAGGDLRHKRPVAYQEIGGARVPIAARYVLLGGDQVGFQLGAYDPREVLIVDPVLVYSTVFGGGNEDQGLAIAVDSQGNVYVAGCTDFHVNASFMFPKLNNCPPWGAPLAGANSETDVFVAKINPAGSAFVWSTYFGGIHKERAWGIAIGPNGDVYVAGETTSLDFPTTPNAYQPQYGGGEGAVEGESLDTYYGDAFVAKFSGSGGCVAYSTFLGGSDRDLAYDVAVDSQGNACVAGGTASTNFPNVAGATIPKSDLDSTDAFFVKMNANGSGLIYSIRFGGNDLDIASGITLDTAGNAYLAGATYSHDFPTVNPIQATHGTSGVAWGSDAFIVEFDTAGSMAFSTFLGAPHHDGASDIVWVAGDVGGVQPDSVFVTGYTESVNFPTVDPVQGSNGGQEDAFVTRLDITNKKIIYSTYLGGSDEDWATGIAVDKNYAAYVVGRTHSNDFPVVSAIQASPGGDGDAFLVKLHAAPGVLRYSTYLGGGSGAQYAGQDRGWAIAVDKNDDAYVTGDAASPNFPVVGASIKGGCDFPSDAFVAKIHEEPPTFTFPEQDCGSCGAVGSATYGAALAGYLCLMFARRRRR